MLINALIDFYEQNPEYVLPAYYKSRPADWILELDGEGGFRGITKTDVEVLSPTSSRTVNVLAHLVFDNASYLFGIYPKDEATGKIRAKAYKERIREAAEEFEHEHLAVLCRFLESSEEYEAALKEVDEKGVGTRDYFVPAVDGVFLVAKEGESPSPLHRRLHEKWLRDMAVEYGDKQMQCSICGGIEPTLRRHGRIRLFGVTGSLINMNQPAFWSHGLDTSANAPTCIQCGSKYVQALRYLSSSNRHTLITRTERDETGSISGQSGWIAWLRKKEPIFSLDFLKKDNAEDALEVVRSIYRARPRHVDDDQFYAVSITASDHRFSIRSFISRSLQEVIKHVEDYFDRQAIIQNGEFSTFSLLALLDATAPLVKERKTGLKRPAREKLPPHFAEALVEHVLSGNALPHSIRDQLLRRCRAEQAVSGSPDPVRRQRVDQAVPTQRAALIKLYLCSQPDGPMAAKKLNSDHPNAAYHCGRLLAVADSVYHATTGSNGYVSKRYYSSASTTPANVIGRIIPNVRHQLHKLSGSRGGYATNLDKLITEIMGRIEDFPKTLMPNEQALFALGFYHQRDHLMTKNEKDTSDEVRQ